MTRHERREKCLLRRRQAPGSPTSRARAVHHHHVDFSENDPLPYSEPDLHHHISDNRRHYQDAFSFEKENPADPATKVSAGHSLIKIEQ
jgi:hypothetical protein